VQERNFQGTEKLAALHVETWPLKRFVPKLVTALQDAMIMNRRLPALNEEQAQIR
jgi:hypothetical protein